MTNAGMKAALDRKMESADGDREMGELHLATAFLGSVNSQDR